MKPLFQTLVDLGFPEPSEIGSMRTIAHLFGTSKPRTGIYALVVPGECVYIGQAKDVVRRFAQHRQAHQEIEAFAFFAAKPTALDDTERDVIFRAESAGVTLLNVVHASAVQGRSDFDALIPPDAQESWLADPRVANDHERETTQPLVLPRNQVERYAKNFAKLIALDTADFVVDLLGAYLRSSVPFPRATEYSFWAVSCMPSTNASALEQRYLCLSAAVMEMFVLGFAKVAYSEEDLVEDPENEVAEDPGDQSALDVEGVLVRGFLNVASDILFEQFGSQDLFAQEFPDVELRSIPYQDGGQNQINLAFPTIRSAARLLLDDRVTRAAGTLMLRVMRKRPTIYSRFHCKQLADRAFASG